MVKRIKISIPDRFQKWLDKEIDVEHTFASYSHAFRVLFVFYKKYKRFERKAMVEYYETKLTKEIRAQREASSK